MGYYKEYLYPIPNGLGWGYLIYALVVFMFVGVPWFSLRKSISKTNRRKVVDSLALALIFAPSIAGYEMGVIVMPAVLSVLITLSPKIGLISLINILMLWFILYTVLNLFYILMNIVKRKEGTK